MGAGDRSGALRRHPGPRRPPGAPVGPGEVRRAVLDAAARLFNERGVTRVSLRDIAAEADVQVALIGRYVGTRDELIEAVFTDLSEQVAREVVERPTEQLSFDRQSLVGQWVRLANHFALAAPGPPPLDGDLNVVLAFAQVCRDQYGLDDRAARLRAMQIVASGLGWRIFEDFLIAWAGLDDVDRETLRHELTRTNRRVGSTPWPSPPDPVPRPRRAS